MRVLGKRISFIDCDARRRRPLNERPLGRPTLRRTDANPRGIADANPARKKLDHTAQRNGIMRRSKIKAHGETGKEPPPAGGAGQ